MRKKYYIIIVFLILAIILGVLLGMSKKYVKNEEQALYNGLPLNEVHAAFMYDTSTPEAAIGASDYVFVAKINKILRTEYKNPVTIEKSLISSETVNTPYTIYSIDVIQNIKGELITNESIEFMQYGGLNEDKKSYTFLEGGELLKEGEYYILMVDTWGKDGGIIEIADTNRIIYLGNEEKINQRSIYNTIDTYIDAYKNQIIPENEQENYISKYDSKYIK